MFLLFSFQANKEKNKLQINHPSNVLSMLSSATPVARIELEANVMRKRRNYEVCANFSYLLLNHC